MTIKIIPIPAYNDNYIWLLHDHKNAAVIDPGLAEPVEQYLTVNNLTLSQILITHHHWDHVNGIEALQAHWQCPVYAPADNRIPGDLTVVDATRQVHLEQFDLNLEVLATPGHTLTHICYYNEQWLFCGDTLFSMGCGRMFEGTAEQFVASLHKLKALHPDTLVYCTHEYTLSNIDFALSIDPNNTAIKSLQKSVQELRQKGIPSLPVKLQQELDLNPFLRTHQPSFQDLVAKQFNCNIEDQISCFAKLRQAKDQF